MVYGLGIGVGVGICVGVGLLCIMSRSKLLSRASIKPGAFESI